MKLNKLDIWSILCAVAAMYIVALHIIPNIVAEWNDVDDYRIVILEKKAGVVTWTSNTGSGKHSKSVHHDAGAVWIKAQRVNSAHTCTWAERNPFHAEAYTIGGTFHGRYIDTCNKDLTPNGDSAFGYTLLLVLLITIFFAGAAFFVED